MAVLEPAYRLTTYAPRSVDATETTALTPRVGAVHSDAFTVASISGVAGFQPYLDAAPRGRRSEINPLEKRLDTGETVWRVLDKKTGTSNLERWVTAFYGDTKGGNYLLGLKVFVEQSLDGGATWEAFFTGRIASVHLAQSKLWFDLHVREFADDLDNEVFFGPPHSAAASYAHHGQVAPIGLMHPYGTFPQVDPIRGTVYFVGTNDMRAFYIRVSASQNQANPSRTLYTKALFELEQNDTDLAAGRGYGRARVWVSVVGSGTWTAYDYYSATHLNVVIAGSSLPNLPTRGSTSIMRVAARPVLGSSTTPAVNDEVDFYIESLTHGVTEKLPLLIDDVHPVTLVRHLVSGYFGRLDDAGAVTWALLTDAGDPGSTFDALEADDSLQSVRFVITKRESLRAWMEKHLLKANNLSLRLNESGKLAIVDHRRRSTHTPVWTITKSDLVSDRGSVRVTQDKDGAIAAVTGKYYTERLIADDELPPPFATQETALDFPDIPTVRIVEVGASLVKVLSFSERALDVGGKEYTIDATGLRFRHGETAERVKTPREIAWRAPELRDYLRALASDLRGPYGLGPTEYELVMRRASATVALVKPGTSGIIDVDEIPDPATNVRGGPRVALCLARHEDGASVRCRLLDWGANSVAVAPTLGAPAAGVDQPTNALTVAVTVNGDSQRVRLDYALTSTSVGTLPAEDDAAWHMAVSVDATSTATIAGLAGAGRRVWIRGRSEPAPGQGFSLPSAWAFPSSGTGYVDLTALSPPTSPSASSSAGDLISFSWAVGQDTLPLEVFIVAGSSAPTGADSERVDEPLAPGSTSIVIAGRTVAATQYTVGVRHADTFGNISAMATATVTTAAAVALTAPSLVDGFSFPQRSVSRVWGSGRGETRSRYGIAVLATVFPSAVEVEEALETAVGSGSYGAYASVGVVSSVAGAFTLWDSVAPIDGKRRKLRPRHVRGANASTYGPEVVVDPAVYDAIIDYPIAVPSASVTPDLAARTATTEDVVLNGAIGAGDAGPLSWRYRLDDGAFSAPSTVALPQSIVVSRGKIYGKAVLLEVTQADGQKATASYSVPAELPSLRPIDGVIIRTAPYDDGDYAVSASASNGLTVRNTVNDSRGLALNTMFGKTADDLDDANDGTTYKKVIGVSSNQITPASSVGRNRCRLKKTGTQALTTLTVANVSFDSEDYDEGGLHSNVTNNHRVTIPAGSPERGYLLHLQVNISFSSIPAGSTFRLDLNDTAGNILSADYFHAQGGEGTHIFRVSSIVHPSAGDFYYGSVTPTFASGTATIVIGQTHYEAIHFW